ncbi:RNA polymerase sigma factor [Hymenobacter daeguensis]
MPLSPELDALIASCRRYEPAAQRQLYARYAALMLGIARRYTRSQEEAEDILQDAFIKVFTRLQEFRGEGSFEGWMRRIVVNTALNHWQSGQHRRQQMPLDDVPEPFAPDADAFDRLGVAEVLALMEQLPDGCRLVLNLYAIDGYSHGEIAELLGIQESTSKAQLSKARKQLHLLHQRQTSYYRL